jgi:hypothetical protein
MPHCQSLVVHNVILPMNTNRQVLIIAVQFYLKMRGTSAFWNAVCANLDAELAAISSSTVDYMRMG